MTFWIVVLRNEIKSLMQQLPAAFWILFFPTILFVTLWFGSVDQENAKIAVVLRDQTASKWFERSLNKIVERDRLGARVALNNSGGPSKNALAVSIDVPPCAEDRGGGISDCTIDVTARDTPAGSRAAVLLIASLVREAARPEGQSGVVVKATMPDRLRSLSYAQFLLSGVIILALLSAGVNVTSTAIVMARDRNVFRSMARFPISVGYYLTLMVLARALAGASAVLLLLLLGTTLFGVQIVLSVLTLPFTLLVSFVAALVFSGVGMMLAATLRNESSVSLAGSVLYLPALFLGNLTFPVQPSSSVSSFLMEFNPATFLVDWLRQGLFFGEYWPPSPIGLPVLVLVAVALHWTARRRANSGLVQVE